MAIVILVIGVILIGTGITGHYFWTRRRRPISPDERRALRLAVVIGSIIAGVWLVAWSISWQMHFHIH